MRHPTSSHPEENVVWRNLFPFCPLPRVLCWGARRHPSRFDWRRYPGLAERPSSCIAPCLHRQKAQVGVTPELPAADLARCAARPATSPAPVSAAPRERHPTTPCANLPSRCLWRRRRAVNISCGRLCTFLSPLALLALPSFPYGLTRLGVER
jgi:hypothetical protein